MSTQTVNERDLGVPGPINIDEIPWVVIDHEWGRTEYKLLRVSVRENTYTVVIRWQAGIRVPTHRHFGPVHAFTFKGKWHYKEYSWFATPGTYVMETAETEHTLVVDEDTEALFVVHSGQVDIGPNGEVLDYFDAQKALEGYAGLLAMEGKEVPAGIVHP